MSLDVGLLCRLKSIMGKLSTYTCKGCLNIRPQIIIVKDHLEIGYYCGPRVDSGHVNVKWIGDYLECLDKKIEPD